MGGGVGVRLNQGCRKDEESCILPQYQVGENGWQWLWWVISSQEKPRSQWVWPTAAHLEPTRQGEDLLKERDTEEEKLSQREIPLVPNAIDLLTSFQF